MLPAAARNPRTRRFPLPLEARRAGVSARLGRQRTALATAAALLFAGFPLATPASAQCVSDLADGDILVADITANQIIRIDASPGADPNANQERVCVGNDGTADRVLFPRSVTNDREGRLWISMHYNIVRADPAADAQITVLTEDLFNASPRGIVKQRDGPVFFAWPKFNNLGSIQLLEPQTGFATEFSGPATGFPLGLIFDPLTGADPRDMLISSLNNPFVSLSAGAYAVNEIGGVVPIATNGFIATPERIASVGDRFIYLTDIGGLADPDGAGPEPPVARPPQVVQIDRTITPGPESPKDNQKVISEGGVLATPAGIVVLDPATFCPGSPACVLVADTGPLPQPTTGPVLRIDFDPEAANPAATSTQTIVSQGQLFSNPWDLRIVSGIDPLPEPLLYVTDVSAGDGAGVFQIDPTTAPRTPLATGAPFVRPNGIVVDPDDTNRLLVADGDLPGIIAVDATTGAASPVSQDGEFVFPTNVIVDSAGDLVVVDQGAAKLIRVDGGGVQTVLTPVPGEDDFLRFPVSAGIDPLGFLQVTDAGSATEGGRLITVHPVTGKQWCVAETLVFGANVFPIDGAQDILFEDSGVFFLDVDGPASVEGIPTVPLLGFQPPLIGFFGVSASPLYSGPRGLALSEGRDLFTVNTGATSEDRQVLRLDILAGIPTTVPNSEDLGEPFGIAIAGRPRPNPAPVDTDNDGILDPVDNCVETANADQAQAIDGYGAACYNGCVDPTGCLLCDATGDGSVGIEDFNLLIAQFGNDCNAFPELDCSADCAGFDYGVPTGPPGCAPNCAGPPDGVVGQPDFARLLLEFGQDPANGTPPSGPLGTLVDLDPACPGTTL